MKLDIKAVRTACEGFLADAQERREREGDLSLAPLVRGAHVRITLKLGNDLLSALDEIRRLITGHPTISAENEATAYPYWMILCPE